MVHVNMASLCALSMILSFATSPTLTTQTLAFVFTVLLLGGFITLLLCVRPYVERKVWKFPVKIMVLAVSLFCSLVNFVGFVEYRRLLQRSEAGATSKATTGLSYLLFAMCLALVRVRLAAKKLRASCACFTVDCVGERPSVVAVLWCVQQMLLFLYKFWDSVLFSGAVAEQQSMDASGVKAVTADAFVTTNPMVLRPAAARGDRSGVAPDDKEGARGDLPR
jgi:hypothetical protein